MHSFDCLFAVSTKDARLRDSRTSMTLASTDRLHAAPRTFVALRLGTETRTLAGGYDEAMYNASCEPGFQP